MKTARALVYSCCVGGYDWIHKPRVVAASTSYHRYSDSPESIPKPWVRLELKGIADGESNRIASRRPKILSHRYVQDFDFSIWIDSSVHIIGDLSPLIDEFANSGEAVRLFVHPSGRSVSEEFDFALQVGRIREENRSKAELQRARYEELGFLESKIFEATILFRRHDIGDLSSFEESWFNELLDFTDRDQVSLPFALKQMGEDLNYGTWDWHFDDPDNKYFVRLPHKPRGLFARLKTGAHFLSDDIMLYSIANALIKLGSSTLRFFRLR